MLIETVNSLLNQSGGTLPPAMASLPLSVAIAGESMDIRTQMFSLSFHVTSRTAAPAAEIRPTAGVDRSVTVYEVADHLVDTKNRTITDRRTNRVRKVRAGTLYWAIVTRLLKEPDQALTATEYGTLSGYVSDDKNHRMHQMVSMIKNKLFHGRIEFTEGAPYRLMTPVLPVSTSLSE